MSPISATYCYDIYCRCVSDYHRWDDVDRPVDNPFKSGSLASHLYNKNWIDAIQWHLEDLIRDPGLLPESGMQLKRRIDKLNQQRTDLVELIDDYFFTLYKDVSRVAGARHNTETLGWSLDRLSILALREYHLDLEFLREDADPGHLVTCKGRKSILLSQKTDLMHAIDWLIGDVASGRMMIKTYKQLKMYNDKAFNPVLYSKK